MSKSYDRSGRGDKLRFFPDLKRRHPDLGCDALEQVLEQGERARQPLLRATDFSPVAKIPLKARIILQIALRRNLELGTSFVQSFNAQLFVPLFIEARAIIETGCLAWDVQDRIKQVIQASDKKALDDLDRHLKNVLLGAKTKSWAGNSDKYPAPNVLTIIDRLTKAELPNLREHYEVISEFAHPNYAGMQGAYVKTNKAARQATFIDCPFKDRSELLDIACGSAHVGLDMSVTAVEYYEQVLTPFVELCEAQVFDAGCWPANIPYPRK